MSLCILIWACGSVALIAIAAGNIDELQLKHVAVYVLLLPLFWIIWSYRRIRERWNLVVWRRK